MDMLPAVLKGKVTPYKGNGRKFGYPTANIDFPTDLPDGVYFGHADLAQYVHRPALIFIGTPTTVGDTERRIEVHLFDADDRDYYNLDMTVSVEFFYRSNKTFDSIEDLLKAMKADEAAGRVWTKSLPQ